MEELYEIVKGLHNLLEHKIAEIEESGTMDSYLVSKIQNRQRAIQAFAEQIAKVRVSQPEMALVIANFKRDAEVIKADIAAIGLQ